MDISLLCATRGEAGKTGNVCATAELGAVREAELFRAMEILGVTDIQLLPYQDKHLAQAPVEEMRRHLVTALRRIRPTVVMTFDPHGTNAHADHIAISRFASDAISAAADRRWFPEAGPPHAIERLIWTPPTMLYRLPPERAIPDEPGFDFVLDTAPWRAQKVAAFEAHATQFPHLKKLFFEDLNGRRTFDIEAFRLAWGPRPGAIPAVDLFAS